MDTPEAQRPFYQWESPQFQEHIAKANEQTFQLLAMQEMEMKQISESWRQSNSKSNLSSNLTTKLKLNSKLKYVNAKIKTPRVNARSEDGIEQPLLLNQ